MASAAKDGRRTSFKEQAESEIALDQRRSASCVYLAAVIHPNTQAVIDNLGLPQRASEEGQTALVVCHYTSTIVLDNDSSCHVGITAEYADTSGIILDDRLIEHLNEPGGINANSA